jgi:hypothetical protein
MQLVTRVPVIAYRVSAWRVVDPGRVLRGDGLQPPAAAVVGEGRAGAEADGLLAVPHGLDVQRRRGPRLELAVDGVQRVPGRRPRREPPDLAGAPARHLQELPTGTETRARCQNCMVGKENSALGEAGG